MGFGDDEEKFGVTEILDRGSADKGVGEEVRIEIDFEEDIEERVRREGGGVPLDFALAHQVPGLRQKEFIRQDRPLAVKKSEKDGVSSAGLGQPPVEAACPGHQTLEWE